MKHKLKFSMEDLEALSIPINRKPKPELPLQERVQALVDELARALPHLLGCIRAEQRTRAATIKARMRASMIEDELRELRVEINNQNV